MAKGSAALGLSALACRWRGAVKRAIDVVGALALLILLAPVFVLAAIVVKVGSPGPVFFRQTRLGVNGRRFCLWKFRTMVTNADERLEVLLRESPRFRLGWDEFQKLLHDPRLTRSGRLLRRFSLDELPQLWNVLKGEMSLVGPRPCLPEQRKHYGAHFDRVVSVRPGMTGLWQVSGRNRLSFQERVALDLAYVEQRSLLFDLQILLRTPWVVLRRDGAF